MRSDFLFKIMMLLLALTSSSCMKMDGFLYNTKELSSYTLSNKIIPDLLVEALTFTSGSYKLYGFFVRSNGLHPEYTVLYNHGNKESIDPYWERVELLWRAGFNVFIYDYRGFGRSEGSSSEEGLAADARAALDVVRSKVGNQDSSIAVYGFSLGGVPAVDLAAHVLHPRVLITESIFASGETLIQSGTLIDIPGSFLLKGSYNNAKNIADVHCPLLMLHGDHDTFIDIDKSGRKIFANANEPKTFISVPGADHSEIPLRMSDSVYVQRIRDFVVRKK